MPALNISLQSDRKSVSRFDSRKTSPSTMSSADWAKIEPAIREKCFFSARVNNAEVLGKMREFIGKALDDTKRNPNEAHISKDKFISEMKSYLKSKGYSMGGSSLTDITSRKRLGLIYQMNVDEAREYGRYVRGQDPELLNAFPAWEFTRIEHRRVPRTDWETRFKSAGGKIINGRMVALKSSEVWTNLSRFGRPYPPFDFGSGMGVVDVERSDAIKLGLIPDDEPADEIPDFDCVLETEVSLDRIPEEFRGQVIKETPYAFITGNKLAMQAKQKLPNWKDMGLVDVKKWKPSGVVEKTISKTEAESKLKNCFSIKYVQGKDLTFSDETIHWRKNLNEKEAQDSFGRLIRLPLAEICVQNSREIWELPNGMRNYILDYTNKKGKRRGVAVSVKNNGDVHTYFTQDIANLNNFRKGTLIYENK